MLKKSKAFVYMCAYDISEHYRDFWQGTGFKAQLVAPDKETAILYHQYLNELGVVSSEVIISAPDTREGSDPEGRVSPDVVEFWNKMMVRFGKKEEEYNKQITDAFKTASAPEILIVVDKLLTGFDVPRNTVMYLCRSIREPATLLQAIAVSTGCAKTRSSATSSITLAFWICSMMPCSNTAKWKGYPRRI